jgi:hypothetical protein
VGGFIPVAVLIMEVKDDYLLPRDEGTLCEGSAVILGRGRHLRIVPPFDVFPAKLSF